MCFVLAAYVAAFSALLGLLVGSYIFFSRNQKKFEAGKAKTHTKQQNKAKGQDNS